VEEGSATVPGGVPAPEMPIRCRRTQNRKSINRPFNAERKELPYDKDEGESMQAGRFTLDTNYIQASRRTRNRCCYLLCRKTKQKAFAPTGVSRSNDLEVDAAAAAVAGDEDALGATLRH
jgi:hypothetical protein